MMRWKKWIVEGAAAAAAAATESAAAAAAAAAAAPCRLIAHVPPAGNGCRSLVKKRVKTRFDREEKCIVCGGARCERRKIGLRMLSGFVEAVNGSS